MCEKRLISKRHTTLIQIKTNKNCIKNGENMWIDTFQRWRTGANRQKKWFDITNHGQGNLSQTHNRLSPDNGWNGNCPRDRHQVWSRVCRRGDTALLLGMEKGAATVTNGMELPEKINTTTTWPGNGSTQYWFGEHKNTASKRQMHSHIHCSIIHDYQT